MHIQYGEYSGKGPVRDHNEDHVAYGFPEDHLLRDKMGSIALLADGVGGAGNGAVASKLAVEEALAVFKASPPDLPPSRLLQQIFDAATRKVYDTAIAEPDKRGMSTTLVVSLFRHDQVTVGHVGDSRVYLIRHNTIRRLTSDHSYSSLQVKLGLLLERDAMTSPKRSILMRSLGSEPICRFDVHTETLQPGDMILQCSDGLYAFVVDDEIRQIVTHSHPFDACKKLVALAERRQLDDNISIQILNVQRIDHALPGAAGAAATPAAKTGRELGPGSLLDGRFELTDLISRSGMASIFKADDRETKQAVAIKVPLMQFESDVATFDRFQREEQIGLSLNHPLILKMFKVEKKSRPYIVMEYLEGQTLSELMETVRPLPEPDAVRIASRVCEALDYMHRNKVVHRDLKPANIMICSDGTIRIMDFGIAKSTQSRRLTFVGFSPTMGTPDYMAPEQVRGKRGDEFTDIYSLGTILYEMTTGVVPFEGENPYVIMNARVTGDPPAPRKLNPQLTPVVEEIILHALERTPSQRHASAAAMKAELDDFEKVELVGRYQRLRAPVIWKSRFSLMPLVIGFVVLQILVGVLLFWYFSRKSH